ncbi:MAG: hypothetical protein IPP40_16065 [bacterium]|nr:hypothetical protein [bacterium]
MTGAVPSPGLRQPVLVFGYEKTPPSRPTPKFSVSSTVCLMKPFPTRGDSTTGGRKIDEGKQPFPC